jgi:hypothetical protein
MQSLVLREAIEDTMKKIGTVIAIANLLILLFPVRQSLCSEISEEREVPSRESIITDYSLVLKDGKVLRHEPDRITEITINGYARNIFHHKNILYYLKTTSSTELKVWSIGYKDLESGFSFESELSIELENRTINRFFATEGVSFMLIEEPENGKHILYRIDLNSMDISKIEDLFDGVLIQGILILIQKKTEQEYSFYNLNINGKIIPLSLKGNLFFKEIVDNRILFISNGIETEIIDLQNIKNLYLYSFESQYLMPEDFNLIIETSDENVTKEIKTSVFYKIFINGHESGRTETGMPSIAKSFKTMLEPNIYHIINLERWELDKRRERYVRANNIYQPHPLKLFIPANRVLRISILFDGKTHTFEMTAIKSE